MKKAKSTAKKKEQKQSQDFFAQTGSKPNYKDVLMLRRFINDRSKVLPQKYTLLSSRHQRKLSQEIKKARFMGLLPYTDRHSI